MKTAFIYPGQGSQNIGMGRDWATKFASARQAFAEIDDVLGYKLSSLMFEGDADVLKETQNAQPAIFAVSMAINQVLKEEFAFDLKKQASFVAGHSLGEYSALTVADAITLADAAYCLNIRGRAMQEAATQGKGIMVALLGGKYEAIIEAVEAAKGLGVCDVANDNSSEQIVLSGEEYAVNAVVLNLKEEGKIKRGIELAVSGAFHSKLMSSAADKLAVALENITIQGPIIPLINNVEADVCADTAKIKQLLIKQVTATVRWRETMNYMVEHQVERVVEIGNGKVLAGLFKKAHPQIKVISLEQPSDLDNFLAEMVQ